MTYLAPALLTGLVISQEYSPSSSLFTVLKVNTLLLSERVMLSAGIKSEPSFLQFLVKTEPEASQVKLTELPSTGRFVDGSTEAADIFSVCQKDKGLRKKWS